MRRRKAKRRTIGFFVPGLSGPETSAWLGMLEAARSSEVNLVCFAGGGLRSPVGFESQSNILYDLGRAGRVEAIVLWGAGLCRYVDESEIADFMGRYSGTPMLCVETSIPGAPSIVLDYRGAFAALVRHLTVTHGCRNIAFAGNGGGLYGAYADAVGRSGIPAEAVPMEPKGLATWLRRTRKKGKGGIISASPEMTSRVYAAAEGLGVRIPRDIPMCGLDVSPYRMMGRSAVTLALRLLDGENVPEITTLKPRLVLRGSCGCGGSTAGAAGPKRGASVPRVRERAEALRELETALLGTFETDELAGLLARRLPDIGIGSVSISLYENAGPYRYPQPAPEYSRLVFASGGKKSADSRRPFASRLLLPDSIWRGERRCFVVVPLHFRNAQLGFMVLEGSPEGIAVADRLSLFISSALQGASLAGLESKRLGQLQAASAVSRASSSILDPRQLMTRVVALIRGRFDLSQVGLYAVDDTGKLAVLRAGTDIDGRGDEKHAIPIGPATLVGACIADARVRISLDPEADAASLLAQDRMEMALPLVSRAVVVGAIFVKSAAETGFGDEEVKILQTMADQVANAVENAHLFQEQKVSEQELKRERNLLRTLIDHIPDYIYVKDTASRFLTANPAVASIMGARSPEELTGKTDVDFYDRPLAEKYREDEKKVLEEGRKLLNYEEFVVDLKGMIHCILTSKVPLRDESGAITGLVGVGRDITAIKQTEEALREQTGRLQMALEVASAVTSLLDVDKVLTRVAELIREKFGYYSVAIFIVENGARAVLRAMSVDSGDREQAREYALPLVGTSIVGHVCSSAEPYVCQDVRGDPHYLAIDILKDTASEAALPLMIGATVLGCLDVQSTGIGAFTPEAVTVLKTMAFQTAIAVQNGKLHAAEKERARELEEAYKALKDNQERGLVAEKMASLGRLTAGIAHEMNTLLAALRASLSEIQTLVSEYREAIGNAEVTAEDHREIAEEMMRSILLAHTAAERTAGFVRGIKTQTRTIGQVERQLFNAVPVIEEALLLLSHALRKSNCTVNFQPAVNFAQLMGSPGRMAQVVTNLVTNSIDACAENGGGPISIGLTPRAKGIELSVADSGAGIKADIMSKIFEPLFTTKPIGVGTGLGLTIIHDIVVGEFGGTVEVSSTPGEGTVFTLFFPAPE